MVVVAGLASWPLLPMPWQTCRPLAVAVLTPMLIGAVSPSNWLGRYVSKITTDEVATSPPLASMNSSPATNSASSEVFSNSTDSTLARMYDAS